MIADEAVGRRQIQQCLDQAVEEVRQWRDKALLAGPRHVLDVGYAPASGRKQNGSCWP
jgi:hypothetical protein